MRTQTLIFIFAFCSITVSMVAETLGQDLSREDLFAEISSLIRAGQADSAEVYLAKAHHLLESEPDSSGFAQYYQLLMRLNYLRDDWESLLIHKDESIRLAQKYSDYETASVTLQLYALQVWFRFSIDGVKEIYEEALYFSEKSGSVDIMAINYVNIGEIEFRHGNYHITINHLNKARSFYESFEELGYQLTIYDRLSNVYSRLGDFQTSLSYRYIALQLAKLAEDESKIAEFHNDIALLHRQMNNFRLARRHYEIALEMAREQQNLSLIAILYNNLGQINRITHNYEAAHHYIEASLKISQQRGNPRDLAIGYQSLASNYYSRTMYDLAEKYILLSIEYHKKTQRELGLSNALLQYADILRYDKRHEDALIQIRNARPLVERVGTRAQYAETYLHEAALLASIEGIDSALPALEKSLSINPNPTSWQSLLFLIELYDQIDAEQSFRYIDQVIEDLEQERKMLGFNASNRSPFLNIFADYVNSLGIRYFLEKNDLERAFEISELTKARTFIDQLSAGRANLDTKWNAEDLAHRNQLEQELHALRRKMANESNPDTRKLLQAEIHEKELEFELFVNRIKLANPDLARFQYPTPLHITEVQRLLSNQTLMISFSVSNDDILLKAISAKEFKGWVISDVHPEKSVVTYVTEAIHNLRNAIESYTPIHEIQASSTKLFDILLGPASDVLSQYSNLIIITDGDLAYLPFEVLRNGNAYLTETHIIRYLPSATSASFLNTPLPRYPKDLLIIADPDYGSQFLADASDGALTSLPSTRLEAEAIRSVFQNSDVLMGRDATVHRVSSIPLEQYRFIHFATHGLVNNEVPETTALLLTPDTNVENILNNDGYLDIAQIYRLSLRAEMVVLSACDSGLGKNLRGEGILGLQRAFLMAGASSVVVSLWPVYDQSTAFFMQHFYQQLHQAQTTRNRRNQPTVDKAQLLQQSRLHVMRNPRYQHPIYWAPFVMIGN